MAGKRLSGKRRRAAAWKKAVLSLSALMLLPVLAAALLLFLPKSQQQTVLSVERGDGLSAVSRRLAEQESVYSRYAWLAAARLAGTEGYLKPGSYALPDSVSAWQLARHLRDAPPQTVHIRITEGMRFAQMRRLIDSHPDIRHDTAAWTEQRLLAEIAPDAPADSAEGLFFPDTYAVDKNGSDLQIYRAAYRKMQRELDRAWAERADGLPYGRPYDLLIMASIIEKETGHADDRAAVASVFTNRLRTGMRLQTDPAVIYGMGDAYQGRIRRADLERDTPYNTYTRHGLPPTPIALPGSAALSAAARPAQTDYYYFVSQMDGSGRSKFSRNLAEHNAAVRRYILKQE